MLATAAFCAPRWMAALVARLPLAWHGPARTPCKPPLPSLRKSLSPCLFLPPSTVSGFRRRGFCPEALIRAELRGKYQNAQRRVSRPRPGLALPPPCPCPARPRGLSPRPHGEFSLCFPWDKGLCPEKGYCVCCGPNVCDPSKGTGWGPEPRVVTPGERTLRSCDKATRGPGLIGSVLS